MVKKMELTLFPAVGEDQTRHKECVVDSPGTLAVTHFESSKTTLCSGQYHLC